MWDNIRYTFQPVIMSSRRVVMFSSRVVLSVRRVEHRVELPSRMSFRGVECLFVESSCRVECLFVELKSFRRVELPSRMSFRWFISHRPVACEQLRIHINIYISFIWKKRKPNLQCGQIN